MTAHVTPASATEIERRVTAGESRAKVGEAFGLLDNEVLLVVNRVRTARAARTDATPHQPASAAVPPVPGRGRPQTPADERPAGRPETASSEPGRKSGEDAPSSSAGPLQQAAKGSPTASRVGRVLTTGSPVGGPTTQPQLITDASKYLEHPDKRIAKAAAAAQKALEVLGGLVFTWEAAETARQEQEKARAEAAEAVEKLEQELAEARANLRAASGKAPKAAKAPQAGPTAAEIRTWAAANDVECPTRGQVPARVRTAYDEAHAGAGVQPESSGVDAEVETDTQEAL